MNCGIDLQVGSQIRLQMLTVRDAAETRQLVVRLRADAECVRLLTDVTAVVAADLTQTTFVSAGQHGVMPAPQESLPVRNTLTQSWAAISASCHSTGSRSGLVSHWQSSVVPRCRDSFRLYRLTLLTRP